MGWRRAEDRGHVHIAHSGGIIGFPAYVALLPDVRLGVVVLSNGPKASRDEYSLHKAIAFSIFDRMLGSPVRDWAAEFLSREQAVARENEAEEKRLREARLPHVPPSLPLASLIGEYEDLAGHSGPVEVSDEQGHLVLRFAGEGAFSAELMPWHGELFRLHALPGIADLLHPTFAVFSVGRMGQIETMSLLGATFTHRTTVPVQH